MWKHIASRYKDNKNVIGYDILNEPFMGSGVNNLLSALLSTIGKMISETKPIDMEELMAKWLNPIEKMELMSLLSDKELYLKMVREVESISQQFDTTYLNNFYNRAGRAIREVDKDTIILLEANYFSNAGMKSGIRPIVDSDGKLIKYQAYSPHGYDLLVDTKMYNQSSNERIDVIFETHKSVQESLDLPMLVGEWGCFPDATEDQLPQAFYLTNIFEKFLSGDTYFDFSHIYNNLITKAVIRAYPMKAAGDIINYHNNYEDGSFNCTIKEKNNMDSSIIYVPNIHLIEEISVEPYEKGYKVEKIEDGDSGYIIIPSSGNEILRTIIFKHPISSVFNVHSVPNSHIS